VCVCMCRLYLILKAILKDYSVKNRESMINVDGNRFSCKNCSVRKIARPLLRTP
jgi:hypothetical protein